MPPDVFISSTRKACRTDTLHSHLAPLKAAFNKVPFGVWMRDRDGRVLFENPAIVRFWGNQMGKTPDASGADPAVIAAWHETNRRVMAGDSIGQEVEYKVHGKSRLFYNIVSPLRAGSKIVGLLGFLIDISRQKRVADALREREGRLKRVLEGSQDGYWERDLVRKGVFLSDRCRQILGLKDRHLSIVRDDVWSMVHPDDVKRLAETVQECVRSGSGTDHYETVYRHCRPDGRIAWILTRGSVTARDAKGRATKVSGLITDITGQREAEDAYRTLADHSLQGLILVQEGRIVYANPAYCELSGYTADELFKSSSMKFEKTIVPVDRRLMMERYRSRLAGRPLSPRYDVRLLRKNGQVRTIEVFASDSLFRGRPAIQAAVIDVTEQRETEEAYRTLAEMSPHGIIIVQDGRIAFANPAYCKLSEYTGEELYRLPPNGFTAIIHPQDRRLVLRRYKDRLGGKSPAGHYQARLLRKSGEPLWIELHSVGIIYKGKPAIQAMFTDITDRKLAEDQLHQRSRQLAQLASELTVSEDRERRHLAEYLHDHLQQVLFSARMQARTLEKDDGTVDRKALDGLRRSLEEALNSSRTVTRNLAPPVSFHKDLSTTMRWLAQEMRTRYKLEVAVQVGRIGTAGTEGENVLLFTAARELLFNVVKHAGCNRASLRLSKTRNAIMLAVSDNGKGARPEALKHSHHSHGFGLFSIRERAELFGGRLAVDTSPGRGMRVRLALPLHAPAKSRPPRVTPRKILHPREDRKGRSAGGFTKCV